jgi:hypothetical protein
VGFGKHYKRCGNRVPLRSAVPLLMPLYASEAPFKVGWINPPEPFRRRCLTILLKSSLVSCPRNNIYFAGSQLAVFQGANERPYLSHTGRESNAEKRPTGSGPKGCDENGPATALLVGHVPHHFHATLETKSTRSIQSGAGCSAPRALSTAHFDRNKIHAISGTGH